MLTWNLDRIKDKNGDEAVDLLPPEEKDIRNLIRKARALESVSKDDIADGTYFVVFY